MEVLTENTQKDGEDNTDSGRVASDVNEKGRASAQKQKKKEGNTLIFDTILSSTRRSARLGLKYKWRSYYSELRRRRRCRRCADARVNAASVVQEK
jgi:hypothetical protein